jgi:drug/metabolite transporter (DMT)-like permease
VILLSPVMLGERLRGREIGGAALAVLGAAVVIVNGIPGVDRELVPHWQGDLLLVLSALCYASYTLLGRGVLTRASALGVTARSTLWGVAALLPFAAAEWVAGSRPIWTLRATAGTLYLALVITALAYFAWNWALERVPAPRAAVFLNVQPVAGALLGVGLLGEPLTVFILVGGGLIVAGIGLTVGNHGR